MASFDGKICTRGTIVSKIVSLAKPVVLTNGVFDILHRGHVTYLDTARSFGGSLVVAVNTDESVKRLGKGDDRPVNTLEDRMAVLAALGCVDAVVPFGEDTAEETVKLCRPDVYVKGGDYVVSEIPEGKAVLSYGGRVEAVAFEFDRSTTALLKKVRANAPK